MGKTAKPGVVKPSDGELTEHDDILIMELKLQSGRFHSSIQVPLFASHDEKMAFVNSWLALMEAGLKCGQAHRASREAEGGAEPRDSS